MTLPVFAINLDRSKARWSNLSDAALKFGIDLRRVPAIDGSLIDRKDWVDVDFESFRSRNGRSILSGEYGCYRSHLLALQEFLDDGAEFGLIIEDDVEPNADTIRRVESILKAMPDFDAIKLVNHRSSFFITAAQTSDDEVGRTVHGPQGSAAAYLVSRKGAERLLSQLPRMSLPWDVALERFWEGGMDVFSTSENILGFSAHRQQSLIASKVEYKAVKSKGRSRLSAIVFRLWDYARRAHNVLLRPATHNFTGQKSAPSTILELLASLAVLVFVSAVWFESDVYRFAGVGLVLVALMRYFWRDLWTYDKPLIGPIGILCIAWAVYVAARFGYDIATKPNVGTGAAEGVYLLPLLYPTLGFALLLYIRHPFRVASAFILLSAIILLMGTDYAAIFENVRPTNILHKNPIHASIGVGFISLCAVPFAVHVLRRNELSATTRMTLFVAAAVTFLLSLLNLYALRSKGVWISTAVALPFLVILISFTDKSRTARATALAALLISIVGVAFYADKVQKVGANTAVASGSVVADIGSGNGILPSMERAIADKATPSTTQQRLMLGVNALHIWAKNPIFGAGIAWLQEWPERKYKKPDYTLMHNGYLEVGMRYGMLGLVFYFTLFTWAGVRVWQAHKARLIDVSAAQCFFATLLFFAVTILSNSNNRLAIGEMFMWFAGSFGFYCYYRLQQGGFIRPRTYF